MTDAEWAAWDKARVRQKQVPLVAILVAFVCGLLCGCLL